MENPVTELTAPQKRPKGLKTKDVKALHRTGMSPSDIANHLGVTPGTITYHLKKKRAPRTVNVADVKTSTVTPKEFAFELNLFGVDIKLQQRPTSIEQRTNAIHIN